MQRRASNICVHIPTELPICTVPPLVVGVDVPGKNGPCSFNVLQNMVTRANSKNIKCQAVSLGWHQYFVASSQHGCYAQSLFRLSPASGKQNMGFRLSLFSARPRVAFKHPKESKVGSTSTQPDTRQAKFDTIFDMAKLLTC